MPRILNAKQDAAGAVVSKRSEIPEQGQKFRLFPVHEHTQNVVVINELLATPRLFKILVPPEYWVLTKAEEEGTFHIKHESGQFVIDGHRPEFVRIGPKDPVTVRISSAGNDHFVIKAPNEDLVWTLVSGGGWWNIEYKESDGSEFQLWRLVVE